MHSVSQSFIHCFVVEAFIHSCVRSLNHSYINQCIHVYKQTISRSSMLWVTHSFAKSFRSTFAHRYIHPFMFYKHSYDCMHSSIHSNVHTCAKWSASYRDGPREVVSRVCCAPVDLGCSRPAAISRTFETILTPTQKSALVHILALELIVEFLWT